MHSTLSIVQTLRSSPPPRGLFQGHPSKIDDALKPSFLKEQFLRRISTKALDVANSDAEFAGKDPDDHYLHPAALHSYSGILLSLRLTTDNFATASALALVFDGAGCRPLQAEPVNHTFELTQPAEAWLVMQSALLPTPANIGLARLRLSSAELRRIY